MGKERKGGGGGEERRRGHVGILLVRTRGQSLARACLFVCFCRPHPPSVPSTFSLPLCALSNATAGPVRRAAWEAERAAAERKRVRESGEDHVRAKGCSAEWDGGPRPAPLASSLACLAAPSTDPERSAFCNPPRRKSQFATTHRTHKPATRKFSPRLPPPACSSADAAEARSRGSALRPSPPRSSSSRRQDGAFRTGRADGSALGAARASCGGQSRTGAPERQGGGKRACGGKKRHRAGADRGRARSGPKEGRERTQRRTRPLRDARPQATGAEEMNGRGEKTVRGVDAEQGGRREVA